MKLSHKELNHILCLLENRRDNGYYTGNPEKYYKRNRKLIDKVTKEIYK